MTFNKYLHEYVNKIVAKKKIDMMGIHVHKCERDRMRCASRDFQQAQSCARAFMFAGFRHTLAVQLAYRFFVSTLQLL